MEYLIRSIPTRGLRLLGVDGDAVIDKDRRLQSVLRRDLGPEVAALFAKPVRGSSTDPVDWYVPDTVPRGPLKQLAELPADQQQRIRDKLAAQLEKIRSHAETLADRKGTGDAQLAELLVKATRYPGDDFVFVVGDCPVVTCWGCETEAIVRPDPGLVFDRYGTHTQARPPQSGDQPAPDIARGIPAARTAATAQTTVIEQHTNEGVIWLVVGFPWGTVFAMLALFIFLAGVVGSLIPACGMSLPLVPTAWWNAWCDADSATALIAKTSDTPALERELADLRGRLASRTCPLPAASNLVETQPPSTTKQIEDIGGKVGEINVLLRWHDAADLDLKVDCPSGANIFFGIRHACGGELDVDMNYGGQRSDTPGENVVFPSGGAEKGRYRVIVSHSGGPSSSSNLVPFDVTVRLHGRDQRISGTVARGTSQTVTTFDVD